MNESSFELILIVVLMHIVLVQRKFYWFNLISPLGNGLRFIANSQMQFELMRAHRLAK